MAIELKCEKITQNIAYRDRKMENVKEKKRNMEFRKIWPNIHLIGNPEVWST